MSLPCLHIKFNALLFNIPDNLLNGSLFSLPQHLAAFFGLLLDKDKYLIDNHKWTAPEYKPHQ